MTPKLRWNEAEDERLVRLVEVEKLPTKVIAREMGRTYRAVANRSWRLGLVCDRRNLKTNRSGKRLRLPAEWREERLGSYDRADMWTDEEREILRIACEQRWTVEALLAKLPRRSATAAAKKMTEWRYFGLRWSVRKRERRKWPEDRLERLRAMLYANATYSDVAAVLGCTRNAVASKARDLGIKKRDLVNAQG